MFRYQVYRPDRIEAIFGTMFLDRAIAVAREHGAYRAYVIDTYAQNKVIWKGRV